MAFNIKQRYVILSFHRHRYQQLYVYTILNNIFGYKDSKKCHIVLTQLQSNPTLLIKVILLINFFAAFKEFLITINVNAKTVGVRKNYNKSVSKKISNNHSLKQTKQQKKHVHVEHHISNNFIMIINSPPSTTQSIQQYRSAK